MAYEFILTECRDDVAVITLNRPDKLNALSFGLARELDEALTEYEKDDAVKAVILTGAGERAFSAGRRHPRDGRVVERGIGAAPGVPQRGDLACRDFFEAADRCHQRARLWRRRIAVVDPRSAYRLRAHPVPVSGGELWQGQFDLVVAAVGRPAESQGAALHRPGRGRRGSRAHRPVEPGRAGGAACRDRGRDRRR